MRELNKDEVEELGILWPLIMDGHAPNRDIKHRVIKLWNNIANTNFDKDTSCSSCLGKAYYGLQALHKEYFKNDI